jgi:hypothetical protein
MYCRASAPRRASFRCAADQQPCTAAAQIRPRRRATISRQPAPTARPNATGNGGHRAIAGPTALPARSAGRHGSWIDTRNPAAVRMPPPTKNRGGRQRHRDTSARRPMVPMRQSGGRRTCQGVRAALTSNGQGDGSILCAFAPAGHHDGSSSSRRAAPVGRPCQLPVTRSARVPARHAPPSPRR